MADLVKTMSRYKAHSLGQSRQAYWTPKQANVDDKQRIDDVIGDSTNVFRLYLFHYCTRSQLWIGGSAAAVVLRFLYFLNKLIDFHFTFDIMARHIQFIHIRVENSIFPQQLAPYRSAFDSICELFVCRSRTDTGWPGWRSYHQLQSSEIYVRLHGRVFHTGYMYCVPAYQKRGVQLGYFQCLIRCRERVWVGNQVCFLSKNQTQFVLYRSRTLLVKFPVPEAMS